MGRQMQEGEWSVTTFEDGTEQFCYVPPHPPYVFIERVVRDGSRRKRWTIVDRREGVRGRDALYPPKLAGPFKELDQAKTVFLVLLAASRFD